MYSLPVKKNIIGSKGWSRIMLYQHSVYSFSGREYSDLEKQDSTPSVSVIWMRKNSLF